MILALLFSMIFLLGAGTKEVELLDNKKLIDLDKAIEYTRPGGAWESLDYVSSDMAIDDNDSQDSIASQKEFVVEIRIRGKNIKYNDELLSSVDELKAYIEKDKSSVAKCILSDDYADSKVYKECEGILKDSGLTVILESAQ